MKRASRVVDSQRDHLKWINIVHDPVYFSTVDREADQLNVNSQVPAHPCPAVYEGLERGSFRALPGENPFSRTSAPLRHSLDAPTWSRDEVYRVPRRRCARSDWTRGAPRGATTSLPGRRDAHLNLIFDLHRISIVGVKFRCDEMGTSKSEEDHKLAVIAAGSIARNGPASASSKLRVLPIAATFHDRVLARTSRSRSQDGVLLVTLAGFDEPRCADGGDLDAR